MPDAESSRDIMARTMTDGRKVLVPYLAEHFKRKGIRELDPAEQKRRFVQAAITDDQERQMWIQEMTSRGLAELVPGSPQALDIGLGIAKVKYPDRFDMLAGEGRDHASDQAEWAMKMAKQCYPEAPETGEDGA